MKSIDFDLLNRMKLSANEFITAIESLDVGVDLNALDIIASDYLMVAIFFGNADTNLVNNELNVIDDIWRAFYEDRAPQVTTGDGHSLYRRLLKQFPDQRITVDQAPKTLHLLREYDKQHQTKLAEKSASLFVELANAVVAVDANEDMFEKVLKFSFEDILNA